LKAIFTLYWSFKLTSFWISHVIGEASRKFFYKPLIIHINTRKLWILIKFIGLSRFKITSNFLRSIYIPSIDITCHKSTILSSQNLHLSNFAYNWISLELVAHFSIDVHALLTNQNRPKYHRWTLPCIYPSMVDKLGLLDL